MSSSGLNVTPLVHAVRDGRSDIDVVAHEVGASAAQLGVPLHEVMDHVERAYAPGEPAFGTVRAAAVAWAETTAHDHADRSCEDPLTSLATLPHLRSRLTEIYREAERAGPPVAESSTMLVVELSRPVRGHELEHALSALDVAEVLRTVFTGDETVARLSSRRFAALARRDRVDPTTTVLVARLLERVLGDAEPVRLWVEHLPAAPSGVPALLAALSR